MVKITKKTDASLQAARKSLAAAAFFGAAALSAQEASADNCCADLEERVAELEASQFSTTTKLKGEVILDMARLDEVFAPSGGTPRLNLDSRSDNTDNNGFNRSANFFTDYGGGTATGRLFADIFGSQTVGGGYHSGLITSELDVAIIESFNRNPYVVKIYGESNYGLADLDTGIPGSDNDFFGTGPSKYAGLVAATYLDGADAFFGGRVELETSINRFDRKRDNDDPGCDLDDPDQNVCLRQGNFWVASRTFGKISVGRAETPSNGIWYTSFGGNAFATSSLPTRKAGNHDIDGLFIPFGVATFEDLGKEHHDIIRYDSPTIAGFTLSAAVGEDDMYDVALRYAGEFGAIRVAAGAGYQSSEDIQRPDINRNNFNMSASVQHTPTGLYLAGAYGTVEQDAPGFVGMDQTDTGSYLYTQFGIVNQEILGDLGDSTFFVEYGTTTDAAAAGSFLRSNSETTDFGVGFVQDIDRAAMSLYATYNHIETKVGGVEGGDIDIVFVGARIKF